MKCTNWASRPLNTLQANCTATPICIHNVTKAHVRSVSVSNRSVKTFNWNTPNKQSLSQPPNPKPSLSSPSPPSPSSSATDSPSLSSPSSNITSTSSPSPSLDNPSSSSPPLSPEKKITKDNHIELLTSYAREENTKGVLDVYQFATQHKISLSLLTYNKFISYFERTQNDSMLQQIILDMEIDRVKPDEYTYFHLLTRCHSLHHHDEFDLLLKRMKDNMVPQAMFIYNLRVKNALTRMDALAECDRVLNEMKREGITPDLFTYTTIMTHLARNNNLSSCFNLLNRMRKENVIPNNITHNVLLGAWRNRDELELVFNEMKRDNIKLDMDGYNVLISVSAKRGHADEALAIMRDAEAAGFTPDIISYNTIINAFAKDQTQLCHQILGEMLERGINPDHRTFNSLVSGWAIQGQFEQALQLVEVMKSKQIPIHLSITAIIDNMIRKGLVERGFDLLERVKREDGVEFQIATYNSLMHGLLERKEYDKCEEIDKLIREMGMKCDHLTFHARLLLSHARAGERGERENNNSGYKLLEEMKRERVSPNAFLYNALLHRSHAPLEEDLKVIDEINSRGFRMDEASYFIVMKKAATQGDINTIMKLYNNIIKNQHIQLNSRIMNNIILAYANNNDENGVWKWVGEMKMKKLGPTDATYTILLDFMYRIKNLDKCIELLEEMETNHIEPEGDWKL